MGTVHFLHRDIESHTSTMLPQASEMSPADRRVSDVGHAVVPVLCVAMLCVFAFIFIASQIARAWP